MTVAGQPLTVQPAIPHHRHDLGHAAPQARDAGRRVVQAGPGTPRQLAPVRDHHPQGLGAGVEDAR